jgi:hypothetical protein
MIYLALEMAVFLILAALAGLIIGWWANHLRTSSNNKNDDEEFVEEDIYAIKNRLDNCFDDNAQLRRKLKSSNHKLEKLSKNKNIEGLPSVTGLNDKIDVLMEDLQIRDDTILALEKELEAVRGAGS